MYSHVVLEALLDRVDHCTAAGVNAKVVDARLEVGHIAWRLLSCRVRKVIATIEMKSMFRNSSCSIKNQNDQRERNREEGG